MSEIKFYCEGCGTHRFVVIDQLCADEENLGFPPWSDIVCEECSFVIATISSDDEGIVAITVEEFRLVTSKNYLRDEDE